ncbi:MAG TPA: hypothetical protein VGJ04_01570, partial [Pirellulales bacterium]
HSGGLWYYPVVMLVGFFPWSIFAIPTTLDLVRRCRGAEPWQRGGKFLASWIVVYIAFFSAAATKLPNYVLPAYPALALATACLIDRWLTQPATVHRWWPRLSFGSLALVGCITAISMPFIAKGTIHGWPVMEKLGVSAELADDLMIVTWLGVALAVGGVAALVFSEVRKQGPAMLGLGITAVVFCLGLFAVIAVRIDRHQPSPTIAEIIRQHSDGAPQVAQFGYFRPSLVYYTDSRVEACKTPQQLAEFLQQSADAFAVTTNEQYGKLAAQLPADIVVVAKCAEFPRQGTVVILGRNAAVAVRDKGRTE